MKVCHLTSVHTTFDTRIFRKECVALAQAGFEVSLVSNHDKDERVDGVEIKGVKNTARGRFGRIFVYTWKVLSAALKTNSEIHHFHDPELFLAGVVSRCLGKEVIFDVHEDISAQIKTKRWLPLSGAASRLYRGVDALSAKLFHLVLAEETYVPLYRRFKPSCEVVLNMPDLGFFVPYVTPDRSRNGAEVFYVGDITNERGLALTVRALARLKRRNVDVIYHCVGGIEKQLKQQLEATKAYQEVKDNIKFYGVLGLDQAYEISKRCKIGLWLPLPGPNKMNKHSTKLFEYMAVQLPVVTSDYGLWGEVVRENACGLCVDPHDPAAVADGIERLLRDDALARTMGANGRKAVLAKYSWEGEKAKLIAFYRGIAGARQQG